MEIFDIDKAIDDFMKPTVYTGVKPVLLIAEELVTDSGVGQIVEAVWVGINSNVEFHYISKFAVNGKIIIGKYDKKEDMEPFCGRVALINRDNLENVVKHRHYVAQIKELRGKRAILFESFDKNFNNLENLLLTGSEVYLFKKKDGDWEEEFFSDFDIDIPYKVMGITATATDVELRLQNSQTGEVLNRVNSENFYGYFIGSIAEINGLKLKSESILQNIIATEKKAKNAMKQIDWLDLEDSKIQKCTQGLPTDPFENYFQYVAKEDIREVQVSDALVETLKKIIRKHMPENDTPLGMEYISIDKLLYLFHMIISRDEALEALTQCDVVYEAPGVLLGYGGDRKIPPKYLVPIRHVAYAYKNFESFISVCRDFEKRAQE